MLLIFGYLFFSFNLTKNKELIFFIFDFIKKVIRTEKWQAVDVIFDDPSFDIINLIRTKKFSTRNIFL